MPQEPTGHGPAQSTGRPRTGRLRSALRRDARRLLGAHGPPTLPLLAPIGPQVPDDGHVQQVLDLTLRFGEMQLSGGESVAETTDTMLRLASAYGLAAVDVDITFTSITICCHRAMAAPPGDRHPRAGHRRGAGRRGRVR